MSAVGSSWNGSWNGGAENPSVMGAVRALPCGIGAGSGPKAWEHASSRGPGGAVVSGSGLHVGRKTFTDKSGRLAQGVMAWVA
jgi:hypothetical protein